jgi:hypothetical protein
MLPFSMVAMLYCNCVTGQQLRSQAAKLTQETIESNQDLWKYSKTQLHLFIPATEETMCHKQQI